jgi:hypothetical protein
MFGVLKALPSNVMLVANPLWHLLSAVTPYAKAVAVLSYHSPLGQLAFADGRNGMLKLWVSLAIKLPTVLPAPTL